MPSDNKEGVAPTVKLSKRTNQGARRNCTQYMLTVPHAIGQQFDGKQFECSVKEDRIIYQVKEQ